MGRKKQSELNDSIILNDSELTKILGEKFKNLSQEQKDELALSLYQFTSLIYEEVIKKQISE